MASTDLQRLWRLAQIDALLLEVRNRAASLDVGQRIQAQIDALVKEDEEFGGKYRTLHRELADQELKQKTAEEKLKKIDKDLYGGKVINPREVEALEKEIATIKRRRDEDAERMLELYDLIGPAKEEADKHQAKIEAKRKELVERRKLAVKEKELLEAKFKELNAKRPEAAKAVSPGLLAKYDSIRQRHGGIGMVEALKKGSCAGCGMKLPEKVLQGLKEERTITCEACHRLLYYTEGLV